MITKRTGYIDIAKGIGILLVVLGHNALVSRFSLLLIYSFHMPLFFFLSGFFFNASIPFLELLNKRFHGLLKPYFFTIFLIYFFYVSFGKLSLETSLWRMIKSFYAAGEYVPWLPLWFLPHLFIVSSFAFAVLKTRSHLLKNRYLYWLFLLAMLMIGVLTIDRFASFHLILFGKTIKLYGLPFSADLLLVSAFFFLLGAEARSVVSEKWLENWFLLISAGIVPVVASILIPTLLDIASRMYPLPVINTIEAVAGIWFVLALSRQIELWIPWLANALAYFGQISLIVLIFHYPIQSALQGKIPGVTSNAFIGEMGSFLGGVIGSVILYELFIKHNSVALYWFGVKPLKEKITPQVDN